MSSAYENDLNRNEANYTPPTPILSRIKRSRVATSGMRSSTSARHISATPSRESSENSRINASTPPAADRLRGELHAAGWEVEDKPGGYGIKRR